MNSTVGELHNLNFSQLLTVNAPSAANYSFSDYRGNGFRHEIIGYCTRCEELGLSQATSDASFRLTNISHGSHSKDFLSSLGTPPDTTSWHPEPVMFVYESPSLGYEIYEELEYRGQRKRPTRLWYWIHQDQERVEFPYAFQGGQYGWFILSAILTFRLDNAYATNLVKCGLNNDEGQFRGLSEFNPKCVETCFTEVLSKEISTLNPKVIFAMGSRVEGWLWHLLGDKYPIQQLPHPAARRRGFRDEHYRALYFWLILRQLYVQKIVGMGECQSLAERFLSNFDADWLANDAAGA